MSRITRPAFTLVELMLSIALVVILMAGINYIFKTAADAVGTGQQLNEFNRTAQAAQPELFDDFRNVARDGPCFIIASRDVLQFLNQADFQTSATSTLTAFANDPSRVVVDNLGNQIGITRGLYNYRDHRIDMVKFFVHGLMHRKSSDTGYISPTTAGDAFVQIGHVALPRNDLASFSGPASLRNPTTGAINYAQYVAPWAADWVLGESTVLLKDPNAINGENYYKIQTSGPPNGANGVAFGANMTPLGSNSPASGGGSKIQSSRLDLAGVTMEQFRGIIADNILLNRAIATYPAATPPLWWNPMVYTWPFTQATATPVMQSAASPQVTAMLAGPLPLYTYALPPGTPPPPPTPPPPLYRVNANPRIDTPLSSQSVAELAPYFIQHCSQFIVEYAGDYLQQDPTPPVPAAVGSPQPSNSAGAITGIGPDGQIDYVWVADTSTTPVTFSKQIRWYGMPRSSGGSHIRGYNLNVDKPDGPTMGQFKDVIPLRDYYTMFYLNTPAALPGYTAPAVVAPPWEVDVNFDPAADYANIGTPSATTFGGTTANPISPRYVAAWYNDMPAMIRILVKVDDPNNKVKDGPWYEFVFRLK